MWPVLPQALGQTFDVGDIPADLKEQADEYHELLVEAAVSLDDDAMEAYLEGTVRSAVSTVLPERVHKCCDAACRFLPQSQALQRQQSLPALIAAVKHCGYAGKACTCWTAVCLACGPGAHNCDQACGGA